MLALAVTLLVTVITLLMYPKWEIVILSASIVYGALSAVIAARRLYFLSASASHIALLAVTIAIPLSKLALNEYAWAVIVGLAMIYAVGYCIHRGIDPDVATAVFVSLSASLSVIAMYIVLTRYSISYDLWAIVLGDPLLVSWRCAIYTVFVAIITLSAVILTYREQICIGLEMDCAYLSGISVEFYDFVLYTLLGVATVAMIKVVGFVLQHVLILLPSAIAMCIAKDSKDTLYISVLASILLGSLGLQFAVLTDQAPSGVIGLLMFIAFVMARCRHG